MSKKKVDQGFELIYWNLSYRRKFIRSLWMIPFALFAAWLSWISKFRVLILPLFIVLILQIAYNYKKWKDEEKENI